MDFKESVRSSLGVADFLSQSYLADLSADELLMRPVPDANHIAWQLGHLISAERRLVEAAKPGTMPALPEGFAERHTKETAAINDPTAFCSKDEYLRVAKEVRAGTLQVLDGMTEAEFDAPVTGRVPPFVKRAGDCFTTIGGHWASHAGQWVVLRRKLGRSRMF